jgi:hypothetical protein
MLTATIAAVVLVAMYEINRRFLAMKLDRIGDRLRHFQISPDSIEMLVVDEERRPVQRSDAH